jgi:hypothetical protein
MLATAAQYFGYFLFALSACVGALALVTLLVLMLTEAKLRPQLLAALSSGIFGAIPLAAVLAAVRPPPERVFASTLGFLAGFAAGVLRWYLRGGLRPPQEQGSPNNRWRGP